MKIILIVLLAIFSYSSGSAQTKTEETKKTVTVSSEGDTIITQSEIISTEEDITPRTSMIVINPLKFLLFYNLSYYHKLSEGMVFGGGLQMPTLSGIDGFGINFELRFYPKGKNLRGFYFAPNFSYNRLEIGNLTTSPVSAGVLIGWQWFPGTDFAMGLGIGVDYYFGSASEKNNDFNSYDGTAPLLRFDIGFAW